jgi:uncharacterized protein YndB with AHSA1/START domain
VAAENETIIDASPDAVFDVLLDAHAYPEWVVGAKAIREVDPSWPAPGSEFHHRIGAGPVDIRDSTTMVERERARRVLLEVHAGPVGSGMVDISLEPAGDGTKVTIVEYPIGGPAKALDGRVEDVAVGARNVESLRRLKHLVEDRARATG